MTLRWRSRLRRQRDDAYSAEIAARRVASAAVKAHLAAEAVISTLRREVADLRRQNLALDAQLDHMTRVNQALDAGITTTTTQERA
jgi:hypothetical protein